MLFRSSELLGTVLFDKSDGGLLVLSESLGTVLFDKSDGGLLVLSESLGALLLDKSDGMLVPSELLGTVLFDKLDGTLVPSEPLDGLAPLKLSIEQFLSQALKIIKDNANIFNFIIKPLVKSDISYVTISFMFCNVFG